MGGASDNLKLDPKSTDRGRTLTESSLAECVAGRLEGWAPKLVLEMTDGRYRSLGTSAQVEAAKARQFLLQELPGSESEAVPEKELLDQADEAISRSTLKRALAELVQERSVRKAKGAGSAETRAFGFWMEGRQR